jgi:mono/diheme cytochrome c family protein
MSFPVTTLTSRLAAAALLVLAAAAGCARSQPGATAETEPAGAAPAAVDLAERGRYLVTVLACNDCHTPFQLGPQGPEPDMSRMLSGHPEGMVLEPPAAVAGSPWVWFGAGTNTAFAGPWGISYATNLTPDEATGIGIWTAEIFEATMRSGRHWGQSRPILPPMPWQAYSQLTDEDLHAIYAYLRTIPPIANRVPDAVVAGPPPGAGGEPVASGG